MRAYKITLLFLDFDEVGPQEAKSLIENARLPNRIDPGTVMAIEEADIGEWHDNHLLNKRTTMAAAFEELFRKPDMCSYHELEQPCRECAENRDYT